MDAPTACPALAHVPAHPRSRSLLEPSTSPPLTVAAPLPGIDCDVDLLQPTFSTVGSFAPLTLRPHHRTPHTAPASHLQRTATSAAARMHTFTIHRSRATRTAELGLLPPAFTIHLVCPPPPLCINASPLHPFSLHPRQSTPTFGSVSAPHPALLALLDVSTPIINVIVPNSVAHLDLNPTPPSPPLPCQSRS
ncbi:hypothetical protein B0H13DRAFT_2316375 [Mycena leptocephala]|nr:hypothetical protein B0H13DRAFT_2316375 [Mycena leptocephala]